MNVQQDEIRQRIIAVVSEIFGLTPEAVAQGISPDAVQGWDSEKHVRLVVALEEQFGILFDPEEVPELTSLQQMEAIVARHV